MHKPVPVHLFDPRDPRPTYACGLEPRQGSSVLWTARLALVTCKRCLRRTTRKA